MPVDKNYPEERRSSEAVGFDGTERRKLSFGVLYTCFGAMSEVEDWLDENCQGQHRLIIDTIDEDLVKKTLRIMFEFESDKTVFVSDYAKK